MWCFVSTCDVKWRKGGGGGGCEVALFFFFRFFSGNNVDARVFHGRSE